jgi:hypothetical protein
MGSVIITSFVAFIGLICVILAMRDKRKWDMEESLESVAEQ